MNRKSILTFLILHGLILGCLGQQPFTAGNIVVYRIGDGTTTLDNTTSKVFLDEYTPSGSLVQSIQMPAINQKITMMGNIDGGKLKLSANGKYLVVPGYNTDLGGTSISERSIGVVDFNGAVNSVTVVASNPGFWPILSAVSDNGTNLWFSGGDGVEYISANSSTSTGVVSGSAISLAVNIADGQLYASTSATSPAMATVGTGLPTTSGNAYTTLPGIPIRTRPQDFAFADLSLGVPGVDVLYLASQDPAAPGGIQKYSLVNGTWVSNSTIGSTADRYIGITVKASGNSVTIFAIRQGNNSTSVRGGELISFTDNSGYNNTITGTPNVIASVISQDTRSFRGVALVPQPCKPIANLQAINVTSSQATIIWNSTNGETNFEYVINTSSIVPTGPGIATNATSITVTNLANNVTYYAHVRTNCSLSPSEWVTIQFTTSCRPPVAPNLIINVIDIGSATIKWNQVFGAMSYEYFLSTSPTPPASGIAINDTTLSFSTLNAVTQYYIHVRSNCGAGALSVWTTKTFKTGCFIPVVNLSLQKNNAVASWNKINNAIKYEYALTNTIAKPLSGRYTTDTSYAINNRSDGSVNYFHVRSLCSDGSLSDWRTIEFHIQGMNIFPNPVNETLNIRLNGIAISTGKITISDATGRMIKQLSISGNSVTIDTRTWASGIYLVRYDDGVNKYTVRVMKQ